MNVRGYRECFVTEDKRRLQCSVDGEPRKKTIVKPKQESSKHRGRKIPDT
jgi:hypothetical protein